jgi:polyhydroxyalkanoate synthase
MQTHTALFGTALHGADSVRRQLGGVLQVAGLGADEAPWRTVYIGDGVRLRDYDGAPPDGPPLLIVPAPIKRAYIWDLLPAVSVVRAALRGGFRVYLAEWLDADEAPGWGFAEYADRFLSACLDAMAASHGERPVIAGHSIGGTLAAVFASLHAPRLRGLVLVEAPLKFGADTGALGPLVQAAPPAGEIAAVLAGAPGTLLTVSSVAAAPDEFVLWRAWDALASAADPAAARIHAAVMRWTLDEFAWPAQLFREVIEDLYSGDAFARGGLRVDGRAASPERLGEVPVAAVVDPMSRLVPRASALALLRQPDVWAWNAEVGTAIRHVTPLVGRRAHAELWPRLFDWMHRLAP